MHELLLPASIPRARALERCDRYLAGRWKRWRLARAALAIDGPRDVRDEVVALLAWHALVREIADSERGFERRRGLEELADTHRAARSGAPGNPIGLALSVPVRRHELAPELFEGPLDELRRDEHLSTFETREALHAHARAIAAPEGKLLLRTLGRATPRNEALADSLAVGLALARWTTRLSADLARGRLFVAVEDLARHGVEIGALLERRAGAGLAALVAEQIAWARGFLAKGWPLCRELGAWRGRQLAFVLRWHAASLSALEAAQYVAPRGAPPAGWLRLVACASASLAGAGPPRLA